MNGANPDPAERPSRVRPGTVGALLRPLRGPPGPPPSCAGSLSRKTRVGGVENRKCPGAPETFPRSAPAGAALRPRPSTERWVAGQPARARARRQGSVVLRPVRVWLPLSALAASRPGASVLAAPPLVAGSLPLALRGPLRPPRHSSAHLLRSQASPRGKRADPGRHRRVGWARLPGHGHLHLHQPAPGLALPAPPLPGRPGAAVSEQSGPCGLAPHPGAAGSWPLSPGRNCLCCLPFPALWEINSLPEELSWRRKWQPTPAFLPGGSQGHRSLLAAV